MLYLFLYNKWYFDELYDFLFVRPAIWLGRFLWKNGDGTIIDGLGPDGIAARVLDATRGAVRLQSGYVYHYALAMLLGVVALATWFMAAGGWRYDGASTSSASSPSCRCSASRRHPADARRRTDAQRALDRADHHHRRPRRCRW